MVDVTKLFKLYVSSGGCHFKISINDIPVFENDDGTISSFIMPINQFLLFGPNIINWSVSLIDDDLKYVPGSHVRVILFTGEDEDNPESIYYSYEEGNLEGTISKSDKDIFAISETELKDSLLSNLKMIDLTNEDVFSGFGKICKDLHSYFNQKNLSAIIEICKQRQLDLSKVFGFSSDHHLDKLKVSLESTFSDSRYRLLPYNLVYFYPQLCFGGKLVYLRFKSFYQHFINFIADEDDEVNSYEFFFGLNEENKFVIVR